MPEFQPKNALAARFVEALQEAERGGDVDQLIELFSGSPELRTVKRPEPYRGPEAARRFWSDYLSAFREVSSTFDHVLEGPGHAVLEWHSDVVLAGGRSICYPGVSILEWEDSKIERFQTYYDSSAFVVPAAQETPADVLA